MLMLWYGGYPNSQFEAVNATIGQQYLLLSVTLCEKRCIVRSNLSWVLIQKNNQEMLEVCM